MILNVLMTSLMKLSNFLTLSSKKSVRTFHKIYSGYSFFNNLS